MSMHFRRFSAGLVGLSLLATCIAILVGNPVTSAAQSAPTLTCNGKPVTITGTSGNDTLVGTEGDDVMHGLGGNDKISGLGGDDTICGGGGRDTMYPGLGDDQVFGGKGFDKVSYADLTDHFIRISGIDKRNGNGPLQIQLVADRDTLNSDTIAGIRVISGTRNDDRVSIPAVPADAWYAIRKVRLGAGADHVRVDESSEVELYTGSGNDFVSLGVEGPTTWTGPGNDEVTCISCTAYLGQGDDSFKGGQGTATVFGGYGSDDISGEMYSSRARLDAYGGPGNDRLRGTRGIDRLYGGRGEDTINGHEGDDLLYGGPDSDVLGGGAGYDQCFGGRGVDYYASGVEGKCEEMQSMRAPR